MNDDMNFASGSNTGTGGSSNGTQDLFKKLAATKEMCPYCGGDIKVSKNQGGYEVHKCVNCGYEVVVENEHSLNKLYALNAFRGDVINLLLKKVDGGKKARIKLWQDKTADFEKYIDMCGGDSNEDPLFAIARAAYLTDGFEEYSNRDEKLKVERLYSVAKDYLRKNPKAQNIKQMVTLYEEKLRHRGRGVKRFFTTAIILLLVVAIAAAVVIGFVYKPHQKSEIAGQDGVEYEMQIPSGAIDPWLKPFLESKTELQEKGTPAYDTAVNALRDVTDKFVVYDLELTALGDQITEFDEEITVVLPLPEDFNSSALRIYYVYKENGHDKYEEVTDNPNVNLSEGTVAFNVDHFSWFVIAERSPAASFDTDGGSEVGKQTVGSDGLIQKPADPIKEGYAFVGWYDGTHLWNFNTDRLSKHDVTLKAKWVPLLSFDANGGEGEMEPAQLSTSVITLPQNTFTRPGYNFVGWSKTPDGNKAYNDRAQFTNPNEPTTLYALWVKAINSVSFDANGGEGTMNSRENDTGSKIDLPRNTFVRDGYTFLGWSTTPTGQVKYEDGAEFIIPTESITLYAVWEGIENKIQFQANGGYGNMEDMVLRTGEIGTLTFNEFYREGYTFAGWSTSTDGPVKYTDGVQFTMVPNGEVLYAVWTPNQNKIIFNASNGTGTMDAQIVGTGETVKLNANAFVRKGYTFLGWSTSQKAGSVDYYNGSDYTMGTDSQYTLYAVWQKNTYTVTYHSNGGSTCAEQKFTIENVDDIKLASTSKNGYDFAGWYTTADFKGSPVTKIDAGDLTSIVLYARWTPKTYTVTLDPTGATLTNNKVTVTFGEKPKLPTLTMKGYTFEGWYTTDGTRINTDAAWSYNSDLTLKAQWIVSTTSVVLNGYEKEKVITFNYNYNGASTPTKVTVAKGGTLNYPSAPSRNGYIFTGWYTDAACTKYFAFSGALTGDVTLYAGWMKPYSSGVNANKIINALTYNGADSPYYFSNSSTSSNDQNYIYLVANESGEHTVNFKNNYSGDSYRYYLGITNATMNKEISPTTLYEYNAGYNTVKFTCNAGDVIVINFYRYNSSSDIYFYFTGFTDPTGGKVLNGSTHTVIATYNQTFTLPTPTKIGYTFGGWFDSKGNQIKDGKWTSLDASISLTAKWTANVNKITLDVNGGTISSSLGSTLTVTYDKAFTLPTPTRTGHTFEGWYNGETKVESGIWQGTGDLTLKAKWTASVYSITLNGIDITKTVTFNYNYSGASTSKVTVKKGETLAIPSTPSRSGYVFTGWYTDAACTKIYTFADALTSDMTLYAGWTAIKSGYRYYNVVNPASYNSNYLYSFATSSASESNQNYLYFVAKETGTHYIYFNNNYSGDYYRYYLGVTNHTTGKVISETTLYEYNSAGYNKIAIPCNAGDVIYVNFYRYSSNSTLYFYFEGFGNLTSKATNGSVHTFNIGYDEILNLPTPTQTGMHFDGWNTKADGTGTKYVSGKWTTMSNVSLYPTWSVQKNTITLETGGVKLDSSVINVVFGKTYTLPTLTRTGYTFGGWYDADGNAAQGGTWQSYDDIKLYAKWTANTYELTFTDTAFKSTVTYNYNYTGCPSNFSKTVSGSNKLPYPGNPSRNGYIFTGWYTEKECKNRFTFSGHIYSDITLYAGWLPVKSNSYSYNIFSNPENYYSSSRTTYYNTDSATADKQKYIYVVANETGAHNFHFRNYYEGEKYQLCLGVTNLTTGKTISATTVYDYTDNYNKISFECNAGDVIAINYYRNSSYSTRMYFYFTGFNGYTSTATSGQAYYSSGSYSTLHVSYDEYVALNSFTKTGYTFAGWYDASGKKVESGKWTTMSNATLTAKWTPNTYKIIFNTDGGKLTPNTLTVTYGAYYTLPVPTKDGYAFAGWYDTADKQVNDGTWSGTADITLKAKWMPATYDITLNGADFNKSIKFMYNYPGAEVWKTVSVSKGGTLSDPGNPTRSGYIFTGWYLDSLCKNRYNFSGNLPGEITLYAGWVRTEQTYYNRWMPNPASYASSGNYASYNTNYTDSTYQNYIYVVANETGTHKIYFRNNYSGANYQYYLGVTNVSKGTAIKSTVLYSYSSGYNSISFECNAGDVIQINLYRYYNNSSVYFYFEGFTNTTSTAKNVDVHSIPVVYGSAYTLPTPEKTGYKFEGWYDAAGKKAENGVWLTKGGATYTAKWTVIQNKITLNADGGSVTPGSLSVTYNQTYTLPTPTRTGYTFLGWYDESGLKIENGKWTTLKDITLTAKWSINSYNIVFTDTTFSSKVTYNYNYGTNPTVNTVTLSGTNKLAYPSIPSRSGYVFTGWYLDAECKNRFDFKGQLTTDITLYAGWQAMYTSSYYANYIISNPANYAANNIASYSTDSATSSNPKYIYVLANETGTHSFYFRNNTSGAAYRIGVGVKNLTQNKVISESILYEYSSGYNKITFDCNAGDIITINFYRINGTTRMYFYFEGFTNTVSTAVSGKASYSKGTNSTITVNYGDVLSFGNPTKTGYTFAGWYDASGKKIESGSKWTTLSGATLTAKWTPNTNKITFNANGGTVTQSTMTVSYDGAYVLPTPTRPGYSFVAWYDANNNRVEQSGTWTGTVDVTYKAAWTPATYSVTLNGAEFSKTIKFLYNYGTAGTWSTMTVDKGGTLAYPTGTPTRNGYVFNGWYTDAECKNRYAFTGVLPGNLTLYAGWTAMKTSYDDLWIVKPAGYNSSSNTVNYSTYASATYQNYIYLVANETGTHTINFNNTNTGTSYSYYLGATNITQGKSIKETTLYSYDTSFKTISFSCNQGDVIEINFYRYSSSSTLCIYFTGFDTVTSTAVNSTVHSMDVTYGAAYTLPTPTKTGYTFAGWYNGNTRVENGTWTSTSGATLTARWTPTTNTLTFNADGGTVGTPSMAVTYDASYTLPTPTRTGYTFLGWFNGDTKIEQSGKWSYTNNFTLKAKWQVNSYDIVLEDNVFDVTVRYDYNYEGTTPSKVTVTNGNTLSHPSIPSRSGYVFTGWYLDADCETRYDFTGDLTADLTLYAGWQQMETTYYGRNIIDDPYDRTSSFPYIINTHSSTSTSQKYLYLVANETGSHTIYFRNRGTSSIYNCDMGITDVTTGAVIQSTATYDYGSSESFTFNCNAGDVIRINYYRSGSNNTEISFYFDGFTAPISSAKVPAKTYLDGVNDKISVNYGASYTLPTPTREGYTFEGWYNGDTEIESGVWTLTNDVELEARWTPTTKTVTYVTNGGEALEASTVVYGESYTLKTPVREGYTFGGWFTDVALTTPYVASTTLSEDVTLYAYWTEENKPSDFTYVGTASHTISRYIGTDTTVVVPSYIGGVLVTGIGESAFYGCSTMTSVTIPDTVDSIGSAAFAGCSSLESMMLPFVGYSADATSSSSKTLFGYIFGTSSYTGGVSTKQYYNGSYYVNYYIPASLRSVTVTGGNVYYGAFYNCSNLTSVVLEGSVSSVGSNAFYNCSALTIYCEAEEQPSGWHANWNNYGREVVWGYTGE